MIGAFIRNEETKVMTQEQIISRIARELETDPKKYATEILRNCPKVLELIQHETFAAPVICMKCGTDKQYLFYDGQEENSGSEGNYYWCPINGEDQEGEDEDGVSNWMCNDCIAKEGK